MSIDLFDRWQPARTLVDLGALSADYFDGVTDEHPDAMVTRPAGHDPAVVAPTLVDLNRAGFVVFRYVVGRDSTLADGPTERRAAVQGFCDTLTLEWLSASLFGTRFQVVAVTTATGRADGTLNAGVPVARTGPTVDANLGRQYTRTEIRALTFGGFLTPTAAGALANAWNVTVFDPEWGPNTLWARLAHTVDPEPMELARTHRVGLPAR